jgi:hypothetical protein
VQFLQVICAAVGGANHALHRVVALLGYLLDVEAHDLVRDLGVVD